MNILNLEATHFVNFWRKTGHNVLSIGPGPNCDVQSKKIISLKQLWSILKQHNFYPDLVFWNDNCRLPSVIGFETLPCTCIGFSIDQYCNPWHVPYSAAFDLFLVAQKDYLPLFQKHKHLPKSEWFPLFCNPERDKDLGLTRDIPVSFVGTQDPPLNPQRFKLLTAFKKSFPLFLTTGNYVPIFARSQLVLNQSAAGELNFRIFQAAACGAAVLTEDTYNGLRDIFIPGQDILLYAKGDVSSALSNSKKALSMQEKLQKIARSGQEKVVQYHTVKVRGKRIIRHAETLIRQQNHKNRLQKQKRINQELAKCFLFISTDQQLPLPEEQRSFYASLAQRYKSLA
jgi:hypothetical protein